MVKQIVLSNKYTPQYTLCEDDKPSFNLKNWVSIVKSEVPYSSYLWYKYQNYPMLSWSTTLSIYCGGVRQTKPE